jgi:DNA-directed RNA polymerase subunit RPC12/RpoP
MSEVAKGELRIDFAYCDASRDSAIIPGEHLGFSTLVGGPPCPWCGAAMVVSQFIDEKKIWYLSQLACPQCGSRAPMGKKFSFLPILANAYAASAMDVRDNGPLFGFCNWLVDHETLPCSRLPGPVEGAPVAG